MASAFDIPVAGLLKPGPRGIDVVVGRFDEVDNSGSAGKERMVLPDLSQCTAPLRMKHSTSEGRDAIDQLQLQDASGKNVFLGSAEKLESNYVVVMKEPHPTTSGEYVYRVMPVSKWYTFVKKSNAPQLSVQEQQELYEMLSNSGPRMTKAGQAFQRMREAKEGTKRLAAEGGAANDDALELLDGDDDLGDNYRSSFVRSFKKGKSGGGKSAGSGAGDGAMAVEAGDFDSAYDEIDGSGGGADGGGDEDGGGNGGSRRKGGYGQEDFGEGEGMKAYDVIGGEGDAVEAAADVIHDYFGDDDGDDGKWHADDFNFEVQAAVTDGHEEDGAAIMASASAPQDENGAGDDDLGVDIDADDVDADHLARAAAEAGSGSRSAVAAAEAAAGEQRAAGAKRKQDAGTDAELRAAKKGKFDDATMRAELVSFMRAQGGRAVSKKIAQNFSRYVGKDAELKKKFFRIMNEVTKQEVHLDGTTYFVLQK